MPRRARVKSRSGIYHVMLRGANRQEIFHDDGDRLKFLDILLKYKGASEISVYAWCLMNNHVHLLIKEGNEPLSDSMKRIGVSYVMYYNWKYLTTGHLFQDRFRSEAVETNSYLLTVVRYIHQNPLKAGIVKKNADWQWSSCAGYYGNFVYPSNLLEPSFVLEHFSRDEPIARKLFMQFNESLSEDECLEDRGSGSYYRLTDDEAREKIKLMIGDVEIAQIKSMAKEERDEILLKVKRIKGISQNQAARIIGISQTLISRA